MQESIQVCSRRWKPYKTACFEVYGNGYIPAKLYREEYRYGIVPRAICPSKSISSSAFKSSVSACCMNRVRNAVKHGCKLFFPMIRAENIILLEPFHKTQSCDATKALERALSDLEKLKRLRAFLMRINKSRLKCGLFTSYEVRLNGKISLESCKDAIRTKGKTLISFKNQGLFMVEHYIYHTNPQAP